MLHIKIFYLIKWIRFDKFIFLWEGKKTAELLLKEILTLKIALIRKYERERCGRQNTNCASCERFTMLFILDLDLLGWETASSLLI